jgi:hypothetical protein
MIRQKIVKHRIIRQKIRTDARVQTVTRAKDIRNWKGSLEGIPAFIIGNSPALDDCDLTLLEDFFTIGINRAYLRLDPTILMWQDKEIFRENPKEIRGLKAIKFCEQRHDRKSEFYNFRAVPGHYRLPFSPILLFGKNGSTGALAFEFAFSLGCKPIVLLGMDCRYRDGKTDFFGVNKYHTGNSLNICSRGLAWIASCQSIVDIISCNSAKRIEQISPLEAVISSLTPEGPRGREAFKKILIPTSFKK